MEETGNSSRLNRSPRGDWWGGCLFLAGGIFFQRERGQTINYNYGSLFAQRTVGVVVSGQVSLVFLPLGNIDDGGELNGRAFHLEPVAINSGAVTALLIMTDAQWSNVRVMSMDPRTIRQG